MDKSLKELRKEVEDLRKFKDRAQRQLKLALDEINDLKLKLKTREDCENEVGKH